MRESRAAGFVGGVHLISLVTFWKEPRSPKICLPLPIELRVVYALSHRSSRGGAFAVIRESSDGEMLKGTLDMMILNTLTEKR
jgi:hypothetical protein